MTGAARRYRGRVLAGVGNVCAHGRRNGPVLARLTLSPDQYGQHLSDPDNTSPLPICARNGDSGAYGVGRGPR